MILTPQILQDVNVKRRSGLPAELVAGAGVTPKPRVLTEQGQSAFWEGREFRAFYEFSIAAGTTAVIRVTTTKDIIATIQTLSLDSGNIRFSAAIGGTAGGTFTPLTSVFPLNQMSDTPAYTSAVSLATGGTHTGGTERDVARIISNLQGNSASTVGSTLAAERGLAASTYYVRIQNLGMTLVTGVYYLNWRERP